MSCIARCLPLLMALAVASGPGRGRRIAAHAKPPRRRPGAGAQPAGQRLDAAVGHRGLGPADRRTDGARPGLQAALRRRTPGGQRRLQQHERQLAAQPAGAADGGPPGRDDEGLRAGTDAGRHGAVGGAGAAPGRAVAGWHHAEPAPGVADPADAGADRPADAGKPVRRADAHLPRGGGADGALPARRRRADAVPAGARAPFRRAGPAHRAAGRMARLPRPYRRLHPHPGRAQCRCASTATSAARCRPMHRPTCTCSTWWSSPRSSSSSGRRARPRRFRGAGAQRVGADVGAVARLRAEREPFDRHQDRRGDQAQHREEDILSDRSGSAGRSACR